MPEIAINSISASGVPMSLNVASKGSVGDDDEGFFSDFEDDDAPSANNFPPLEDIPDSFLTVSQKAASKGSTDGADKSNSDSKSDQSGKSTPPLNAASKGSTDDADEGYSSDSEETRSSTNLQASRIGDCDAIMRQVGMLGTKAAANNDEDQRRQIQNAAEAGRQGAEKMKDAAITSLVTGLVGSAFAIGGSVASGVCALKAGPGSKNEIAANTKMKTAMEGEKEFGDKAKGFEAQAVASRAKASELEEANAGLKKMAAEGHDVKSELHDNTKMMEKHLAESKGFDAEASAARDNQQNSAHERAMASADAQIGSSERNRWLEHARSASTAGNAASSFSSATGSISGFFNADKASADAERNEADSRSSMAQSTKQSMYSNASEFISNQKELDRAIMQSLNKTTSSL